MCVFLCSSSKHNSECMKVSAEVELFSADCFRWNTLRHKTAGVAKCDLCFCVLWSLAHVCRQKCTVGTMPKFY